MPCFLCREELGEYFAVDIGGTNYRVIYVKLSPEKSKVVRTAAACSRPVLSCRKCIFLSCSCGGGFTTPWWSAAQSWPDEPGWLLMALCCCTSLMRT